MTTSLSKVPSTTDLTPAAGADSLAPVRALFTSTGPSGARVPRTGGAEELRAWARWIGWRRHKRARWKLRVSLNAALTPPRAAAATLAAVREYGAPVAERYGVSTARQLRDVYALRLRYGLEPDTYYQFQLFRPERRRRVAQYVDSRQYETVLRFYLAGLQRGPSGPSSIFLNKRVFEHWCAEHGLASLRTLLELAPGADPDLDRAAAQLPEADLFSKPSDLAGGKGTARWTYAGARRWRGVITLRPLGGEPYLLLAVQRMPVGDSVVDNFGQGGLAAPVDVATGRLHVATLKSARHLGARVDTHPTTGTRIEGYQLPYWAELADLVCRAHRAVSPVIPVVGWDVAIAESGPVLVEANNVPGTATLQIPWEEPFGTSPIVACLLDYVRLRYGRAA